jgi:hypothetical protein
MALEVGYIEFCFEKVPRPIKTEYQSKSLSCINKSKLV